MDILLNLLLFPKSYFKRLNNNRATLFLGIIFVGLADIYEMERAKKLWAFFTGQQSDWTAAGIVLLAAVALIAGAVDVFIFAKPMHDLGKTLKKAPDTKLDVSVIKVMKVYISAHLAYVPLQLFFNYLYPIGQNTPDATLLVLSYVQIGLIIWFSGIISRGINSLFELEAPKSTIIFFAVFLWNFIWGMVLGTGIEQVIKFITQVTR